MAAPTTVTNVSDNPQNPSATSQAYLPDQLIAAGNRPPVTAEVLIGGTAILQRGQVLGQLTSGDVGSAAAASGNVGDGTFSAISKGSAYKPGTYSVVFSGPTAYEVFDPEGEVIAAKTTAGAFTSSDINFTFTAHTNAMAAGDSFTIQIAAGTGPYVAVAEGTSDGSQTAIAILVDVADPTQGGTLSGAACGVRAGIYLSGEFNEKAIIYDSNFTPDQMRSALRSIAIYLKGAVSAADPTDPTATNP
jgi:hypothetical protein